MFAILLSKDMTPFYQNIASFPTVIFTVLLCLCIVYWAGALLGLIDLDVLNIETDLDLPGDAGATPDVLAGLLIKFKLVGVPVIVTISLIALFGWFISYYAVHFIIGDSSSTIFRILAGLPIFAIAFAIATWLTSHAIKPLRKLFKYSTTETHKHIIGQTAVVRTMRVDANFGEASLADGGAGLILKVRSTGDETFAKGDRVVIFERLNDDNIYRVISEEEFSGL